MPELPDNQVTALPILETKLYSPRWRPGLVSRPRLLKQMHQGSERKLMLISAPAGFGKSTLLAESLVYDEEKARSTAWVSLDQNDNDPTLFWSYTIRALQKVRNGIGTEALQMLHSPQQQQITTILTALINSLNTIEENLALILDDYHVINSKSIHHGLIFLIDHLPPQMHLVIASRSDPPFPLARMRARGESAELRASDLRFTPEEAATFLNEKMGLDLTAGDISALEKRTEGWIAGLQLAALSVRGRTDAQAFIATFAGDDRYIADYLVEEVLQRQPNEIRSFLLKTAILKRLNAQLCDALTGRDDSKTMLEDLERSNLFVVPLDDKRIWYRYHHLFADVLLKNLIEDRPDQVTTLHRLASEWYQKNGFSLDAVFHALAAEDFERAADLIELIWPEMRRNNQEISYLDRVRSLPEERIQNRPVLNVNYAWALLNNGEYEAAEKRLQDAEKYLEMGGGKDKQARPSAPEGTVIDERQFQSLPASIANARAYSAQSLGDADATVNYARQALDLLPEENYYERGTTSALLAFAFWSSGDLNAAYQSFADGLTYLDKGGSNIADEGGVLILAMIRKAQGRLKDALNAYQNSIRLLVDSSNKAVHGLAEMYLELSDLYVSQGNIKSAEEFLLKGMAIREAASYPGYNYFWPVVQARIKIAKGELDEALDRLNDAERLYYQIPIPNIHPIPAQKARIWIAQGQLDNALEWVHEQGISPSDDLNYIREFEHITLARILLAQFQTGQNAKDIQTALELLSRLREAAEKGKRKGSLIEILVLEAMANQAVDNLPAALESLAHALSLAEPEGFIQIFLSEGISMRNLLRDAAAAGIGGTYTRHLLSTFEPPLKTNLSGAPRVTTSELVEQLTLRELEILRLIASGLRNKEIADQLFISLATVKRHVANIYGKLNVSHRTEAVARANELNLL